MTGHLWIWAVGSHSAAGTAYEPGHEKTCLMSNANNKSADQPAHLLSLISTFVVCYLDSIIPLVSISKTSILACLCSWAGWFESYLVTNPKTDFLVKWLILFASPCSMWCYFWSVDKFGPFGSQLGLWEISHLTGLLSHFLQEHWVDFFKTWSEW